METKKKHNYFFKVLLIFFIIFLCLMFCLNSGYYEAKKRESVVLTDKAIKDFEQKLANNEEINLDSYLIEENHDYSNSFSHFGVNITSGIEKVMSKSIETCLDVIKTLF